MKLSLCILQEWLRNYSPRLETKRNCSVQRCSLDCLCIENTRLYTGQEEELRSDRTTLFVGRHCDFFPGDQKEVVCIYTESTLLLATDDLFSVFNEILNAFRFYEGWCNDLLHLIDQHCTLSELLDLSDPVLQNPIFVLDADDYLIANTSRYENIDIDDAWSYIMQQRHSPEETVFSFHDKSNHYFNKREPEPYMIRKGLFPRNTLSQNLFYNEEWCGICAMIEYASEFNTGKMHLLKILCNYVQLWINKQTDDVLINKDAAIFLDMLEGKDCDSYRLQHKLQLKGWEEADACLLIYAASISSEFYTQNYLCRIFSDLTPYLYAVSCDTSIVMLCDISKYSRHRLLDAIAPWLKRGSYHCGLSSPFTNPASLPAAYQQALIAFQYGERKNRSSENAAAGSRHTPEVFHDIQNYMLYSILDHLQEQKGSFLMHPGVSRLLSYDKSHGTSYAKTLLVYLENERSIKETALQLSIHRNTLLQRIQRFSSFFEIPMESPDERLYLLLSLRLSVGQDAFAT